MEYNETQEELSLDTRLVNNIEISKSATEREGVQFNLSDKHRENLRSSSLSDETINKAGYRSGSRGWEFDITNPWTGEVQYSIVRLESPQAGEPKYKQPLGSKPYPYFSKQLDWRLLLDNPQIPLILTEGAKKADAAIQAGFPTVSFQGTYGWSKNGKAIKEMSWIFKPGRTTYLCFDSDQKENESVQRALTELAKASYRAGCVVRTINMPRETKGIDDFFVRYGNEGQTKFQELIDTATNPLEGMFFSFEDILRKINSTSHDFKMDYSKLPKPLIDFHLWSKDSTHSPDEIIINNMIGTLAAALGKQVAIKSPGGKITFPNLWLSGIAPSGMGKTTACNIALDFLHEINNDQLSIWLEEMKAYDRQLMRFHESEDETLQEPERPKVRVPILPSITSKERLYETLAYGDGSGVIATSEELSAVLADINHQRNEGFKPIVISLYGGSKAAPQMDYKSSKALPIIREPAVGILGVSTLGSFFETFKHNDFHSGFLQRFCFVVGSNSKPKLAFPPERNFIRGLEFQELVSKFFEIGKYLKCERTVYELDGEAKQYWISVYNSLDQDFGLIFDDAVISCFERLNNETVFKIATIFHCLENPEKLSVSKETLIRAIDLVKFYKYSLLFVLEQMKTATMRNMASKIVGKLQRNASEGLSLKRLKDSYGGYKTDKFDEALDWLIDLEIVEVREIPNESNNDTTSKVVYLMLEA